MKNFSDWFHATVMAVILMFSVSSRAEPVSKHQDQPETTINIGIYAPFSEESAFIGRNMLGALEIARDQIESSKIHYALYTLDKTANQAHAAQTLQKFIEAHHINVLLTEGSDSGSLAGPIAKKNKLIHFCFTDEAVRTDGKNNFVAQSPDYHHASVLATTTKPDFVAQFQREYLSHPVTEAGYAFDVFNLVHRGVVLSIKNNDGFSSKNVSPYLLALHSGVGVMGAFHVDKKGILYEKQTQRG